MAEAVKDKIYTVPAMALRGLVCFPGNKLHFDVGRAKSIAAIEEAVKTGQKIFIVAQKNMYVEDPKPEDLYRVGCMARICQILRMNDGAVKVLAEGICRADTVNIETDGRFITASVCECKIPKSRSRKVYLETLVRKIREQFAAYLSRGIKLPPDIAAAVENESDVGALADYIAFNVPAPVDDKQFVLEQLNPVSRAKLVLELLGKEAQIADIDNEIADRVKVQIDENQREYYLREQVKAINYELYGDSSDDDIEEYSAAIEKLSAPQKVKQALHKEVLKLQKMPFGSQEATVVRNYLDTCLELPWNTYTDEKIDISAAVRILNRDFYGMDKVKERIIEQLSVYKLNPDIKGQIICLVGPPGVGKTSIARTIAECMGRKYVRISLGGIQDEAEIRGHRRTYIGAMPGKIINAVKQAGSSNPLILLDEIDKLVNGYKGDPSAALLEVLDKEQNNTFTDHFIDMPYDLSRAVFVTTANTTATIPEPLRDRMEIIELTSYTVEEKFKIAKEHLVKKEIENHGLNGNQVRISDEAIYDIIDFYTREAGVRKLERTLATLCRKTAVLIASEAKKQVRINSDTVIEMLGEHKYRSEEILKTDEVGIINGLAWTSVGGELMQLEVSVMEGTGKLELTGSLGDVMRESARAAVSYVRASADKYGIKPDFYKTKDIHIHATESAVPKDGPSAGVTIATALVSALTGIPVRRDVAMTGEITVKGRVLAIGGLKEKTMAAYRAGVKTVFIPAANKPDLSEIDQTVLKKLNFIVAENADTVISAALVRTPQKSEGDVSVIADAAKHAPYKEAVNIVNQ